MELDFIAVEGLLEDSPPTAKQNSHNSLGLHHLDIFLFKPYRSLDQVSMCIIHNNFNTNIHIHLKETEQFDRIPFKYFTKDKCQNLLPTAKLITWKYSSEKLGLQTYITSPHIFLCSGHQSTNRVRSYDVFLFCSKLIQKVTRRICTQGKSTSILIIYNTIWQFGDINKLL